MSDERLRALERRYKETGAVEDEAAWLSARARVGQVPHLELAAVMGHAAARRALTILEYAESQDRPLDQREQVVLLTPSGDARRFLEDMHVGGHEAVVRGAIAVVRAWLEERVRFPAYRALPLLRAAEAWALDPSEATRSAARDALDAFEGPPAPAEALLQGVLARTEERARQRCSHALLLMEDLGHARAIQAMQAEVVPWALGGADPLGLLA